MTCKIRTITAAVSILTLYSITTAGAHVLPWRAGESRQVGYGHCAKGPCRMRTCWAPSKPHRHVGKEIVTDRFGPPSCFDNKWDTSLRTIYKRKR